MQRTTRQKKAIREVIEKAKSPLTPAQICEAARQAVPGLGIATVYRALRTLVEEELVATIEISGEPPRYESAQREHHHHFLCRACGKIFELVGCVKDLDSLVPSGFQVDDHEIVLYGHCKSCRAAS